MEGLEEVLESLHYSRVVAHHALLAILQSIFDISTMSMMIETYGDYDGKYCDGDPL